MGSSARMVALCSVLKKNQEWKRSYSTFGFSHIIMRQTCNFYSLLHALMFSWRNIYKGKLLILRGVRKFCRFFGTTTLYASPKKWRQKKYHFYSIEQLMRSLYGVSSTHLASHCYSLSPFKSFRGIGFHRCRQKELSSQILSLFNNWLWKAYNFVFIDSFMKHFKMPTVLLMGQPSGVKSWSS